MKDKHKRELKIFVANGSAVLGAFLTKRAMEKLLVVLFDKEPPKKPDKEESTTWTEALAWAALTGAMTGAIKLLIRRSELENIL